MVGVRVTAENDEPASVVGNEQFLGKTPRAFLR
jgi:hypothetical protein